jgi:hypothetical protein
MAKYNADVLRGQASGLYAKSWWIALPYCLIVGFGSIIVQRFTPLNVTESVPPIVWFIVGGAYGLFKGNKFRIQAQMVLCAVEQESHLRLIKEWAISQCSATAGWTP